MKLLEGKSAIVTGSGQGIGRAVAKGLAAEGAKVVIAELNAENGARVARDIETAGNIALAIATDVSNQASVENMVAETLRAFGTVDILVNNAAIFPASSVAEMKVDEWEQVLRTNLSGTFFCSRAVMPTMKAEKAGRIINFTSGRALEGSKHGAHYAASKGGIIGFTKSLALELATFGINVNSICPGAIDTPQPKAHVKTEAEFYAKAAKIPVGRVGQPEDLVGPVLFLASHWSAYVTGQMIVVNGGSIMW
ncbi:MAG TPA: SDR family NAD(P)-dependent oxidoreductase [Candidatus Binatia bacterium]|jgi:3-oxoacyl-[acyl-carrier protein] reductase